MKDPREDWFSPECLEPLTVPPVAILYPKRKYRKRKVKRCKSVKK